MKPVLATLISALFLTLLVWGYQTITPTSQTGIKPQIILTSEHRISEDTHLELTQKYGEEFSSIILSKPIGKGSSSSYLALLILVLPVTTIAILFYSGAMRIMKKQNKAEMATLLKPFDQIGR